MYIPFKPCDMLIPKCGFEKWSVVACDQYTSDSEYWKRVEDYVSDAPSALKITLPEIYLEENDVPQRIEQINKSMYNYISSGLFSEIKNSYIYTERCLSGGKVRKGIIGVFDLEFYDFGRNSSSQIRATESTVIERIPPRVKIRENAPLELPHIMILIDDRKNIVMNAALSSKKEANKLYDFNLMEHGGHLCGYRVFGDCADIVNESIESLYDQKEFEKKYGIDNPLLIFAVGDGNHSLATAKTCWENIKKGLSVEEQVSHPARYAMAEIVNVHDESLKFEPIHRLLFNVNVDLFKEKMEMYFFDYGIEKVPFPDKNCFTFVFGKNVVHYKLNNPKFNIIVGDVQNFLDWYMENVEPKCKIDYIHGEKTVYEKSIHSNTIGILLPAMEKNDLFKTVMVDGVLPRKTFSMGHADEKRYYLECRKIK